VFLTDLESNVEDVARTLLKYGDFFRFYKQYLNGYEKFLSTLNDLRHNKKFQGFLSEVRTKLAERRKEEQQRGLPDLMSYMIMPVQRLPRYLLLLKALKMETSPLSPHYSQINEALTKISEVTMDINEAKRNFEFSSKVLEIQSRIQDLPKPLSTLLEPGRQFVRSAKLVERESTPTTFGTYKTHRRVVYLFSDLIIWVNASYKYKGHMKLATATLENGESVLKTRRISVGNSSEAGGPRNNDQNPAESFLALSSSSSYIILQFPDSAACSQWTKDISPRIERSKNMRSKALAMRSQLLKKRLPPDHSRKADSGSSRRSLTLSNSMSVSLNGEDY
jgi:hypothetical protein